MSRYVFRSSAACNSSRAAKFTAPSCSISPFKRFNSFCNVVGLVLILSDKTNNAASSAPCRCSSHFSYCKRISCSLRDSSPTFSRNGCSFCSHDKRFRSSACNLSAACSIRLRVSANACSPSCCFCSTSCSCCLLVPSSMLSSSAWLRTEHSSSCVNASSICLKLCSRSVILSVHVLLKKRASCN